VGRRVFRSPLIPGLDTVGSVRLSAHSLSRFTFERCSMVVSRSLAVVSLDALLFFVDRSVSFGCCGNCSCRSLQHYATPRIASHPSTESREKVSKVPSLSGDTRKSSTPPSLERSSTCAAAGNLRYVRHMKFREFIPYQRRFCNETRISTQWRDCRDRWGRVTGVGLAHPRASNHARTTRSGQTKGKRAHSSGYNITATAEIIICSMTRIIVQQYNNHGQQHDHKIRAPTEHP